MWIGAHLSEKKRIGTHLDRSKPCSPYTYIPWPQEVTPMSEERIMDSAWKSKQKSSTQT